MKMRAQAGLAMIALLAAVPGAARAQEEPAGDEAIVVTGDRDREQTIRSQIEAVTVETDDQLARFSDPICPASFGLPPGYGEVIVERVREVAARAGLATGAPGCRPNIVILVAGSGGDFVHSLRRERPDMFAGLEPADVRAVMRADGPVRVWQLVEPRGADGRPMRRIGFIEGGEGPPRPTSAYELTGVMPSLTQRPTRQDLSLSFVVFDLDAIEGLTLIQIADHAAIRALARTRAAALPVGRSILGLFADRRAGALPAEEMTDWDFAYLSALYRSGRTLSAHQQRSSMARAIGRALDNSTPSEAPRP
jgi:hypothetical protein